MPPPARKLVAAIRRDGLLRLSERVWAAACGWSASWRISQVLGRLRNLWRAPRLRSGGRLNLGCGPDRRAGWINADLGLTGDLHLNATQRFPLADASLELIFCEHLLEHLTEAGASKCLSECHRVLQPGGLLRLSTPDLAQAVAAYLQPAAETLAARQEAAAASRWKYPEGAWPTPAQALNDGFYLWEHRHLYDRADLERVILASGFAEVTVWEPGVGSSQLTCGLETRTGPGSLVIEARKRG